MRAWRELPGATLRLYSPVGLLLVDGVTGDAPIGLLRLHLEKQVGTAWAATGVRPVFTPGGIAAYPGLGRTRDPVGKAAERHRVRVEAELYRARYAPPAEGFEFDVHPYSDVMAPAATGGVMNVVLAPAAHYPFPPHVPVIHGAVRQGGKPAADAVVAAPGAVDALTDERGAFSLALVKAGGPGPFDITVTPRSGAATVKNVTLPDALEKCVMILLP